jgi:hypothetical protein
MSNHIHYSQTVIGIKKAMELLKQFSMEVMQQAKEVALRLLLKPSRARRQSEDFSGNNADMICQDLGGFIPGRNNDGTPGQVVGFSEQTTGSLMDGGDSCRFKQIFMNTCDGQMMEQIGFHALPVHSLEMASPYDP